MLDFQTETIEMRKKMLRMLLDSEWNAIEYREWFECMHFHYLIYTFKMNDRLLRNHLHLCILG